MSFDYADEASSKEIKKYTAIDLCVHVWAVERKRSNSIKKGYSATEDHHIITYFDAIYHYKTPHLL